MKDASLKIVATTIITGILSLTSYVLLYTHQNFVIQNFTRGGTYALLPIITAFYFSFIHGAFTSNLLHLMGVRVKNKIVSNTGDSQ